MAGKPIKLSKREFSIHKIKLLSGKETCIPMTRVKSKIPFYQNEWERIVEIYGHYELMEINFEPKVTIDCEAHIRGFQKQLLDASAQDVYSKEIQIIDNETTN